LQDGKGVEVWYLIMVLLIRADESKYEGNYVEGKKHRKGIYTWADGSKYEGEWKDNQLDGIVIYIHKL
jgi:hypothetical protein